MLHTHFKRDGPYTKSFSFQGVPFLFYGSPKVFGFLPRFTGTVPGFVLTITARRSLGCIAFYKTNTWSS